MHSAKYVTVLFLRVALDQLLITFRRQVADRLANLELRNMDELFYLENWHTDPGLPGDVCPACGDTFFESPGVRGLCAYCENVAEQADATCREEEYADAHYDMWAREEEELTPYC